MRTIIKLIIIISFVGCKKETNISPNTHVLPNVKAFTFKVINNEWNNRIDPTCTYNYTLSAITDDVVNGGAIIGFVRSIDNINLDKFVTQEWTALPYTNTGFVAANGQSITILLGYGYEKNEINLRLSNNENIPLPEIIPNTITPIPGDLEFKFVVIPKSSLVAGVPTNASYKELTKIYNFENIEL